MVEGLRANKNWYINYYLLMAEYLKGAKKIAAEKWMHESAKIAKKSLCLRAKCGSVIVSGKTIIGKGYNAPPLDDVDKRKCLKEYRFREHKKNDRTCCMHAEWRAILDALNKYPEKIKGSILFFTRVDDQGKILKSGNPYCTVCSRLALDVGIDKFILWHEGGVCSYPTREYNELSYRYIDD